MVNARKLQYPRKTLWAPAQRPAPLGTAPIYLFIYFFIYLFIYYIALEYSKNNA
jgi:hypothetical protein